MLGSENFRIPNKFVSHDAVDVEIVRFHTALDQVCATSGIRLSFTVTTIEFVGRPPITSMPVAFARSIRSRVICGLVWKTTSSGTYFFSPRRIAGPFFRKVQTRVQQAIKP